MAEDLNPEGSPVPVGRLVLRTPGLAGRAETRTARAGGMRGQLSATAELESALRLESMEVQDSLEITEAREVPGATAVTRSTSLDQPAITVDVPAPGEGRGQVMLVVDEAGVTTWQYPEPEPADDESRVTRGEETKTYVIRRYVPTKPSDGAAARGLIGAIGSKIISVLAFPLVEEGIGRVADHFVSAWEGKNRPYRVRTFTAANYRSSEARALENNDWVELSKGPALLFVHGTFSTAHGGFGGLSPASLSALNQRYEGRLLAFDHPTVSTDPIENATQFIQMMPSDLSLDVDIVCHSRGGLVSRVLAEKQEALGLGSRALNVRRIAFVATPNAGTILTDFKHLGSLVDAYTNLLNFIPDSGIIDTLQIVVALVKQLAVSAFGGLKGLEAMQPRGEFLKEYLNLGSRPPIDYFAITSNYEPTTAGFQEYAKDIFFDKLFGKRANDLVVPTEGVYRADGADLFSLEGLLSLPAGEGVGHSDYFRHKDVRDFLHTSLTG